MDKLVSLFIGSVLVLGIWTRDAVLSLASVLRQPEAPGIFCLLLVSALLISALCFVRIVGRRVGLLKRATKIIKGYDGPLEFQQNVEEISLQFARWKGADARHLSDTWAEFRETTIDPKPDAGADIKNSIRPSVFFNLDEMGFGAAGWRFLPGLFVSIGLAATFLGLIAALQQTGESLQAGGDQAKVLSALTQLLTIASAKFIMSLTGLVCSIVFTVVLREASRKLERAMRRLTHEIELQLRFISLEEIAGQQLEAILEQRNHMQKLNHDLIAAISAPLEKAMASGANQVEIMIGDLAESLSGGLMSAMSVTSERLEAASQALSGLASSISTAAEQFSSSAERTAVGLDGAARRLEIVSDNLSRAGDSLANAAEPIVEAADKTAVATRNIAASSVDMVESARPSMAAEKEVVIAAANSIREQIKTFESRAAAYDGQLEKAFAKFIEEVDRSVSEVEAHSNRVHEQYADALATLQAVIADAKAFEPESARPEE